MIETTSKFPQPIARSSKWLPHRLGIAATFGVIACLVCLAPASGAVVVNVQDASLSAGGTGFVDVLIDITAPHDLDFASYDFRITNVGSPSSTLEFTGLTGDAELNYVFAGDSLGLTEIELLESKLVGSDETLDPLDATPAVTGTGLLLARLNLQSVLGVGGSAAAVGDQFRITLEDSTDTLFIDGAGDDIILDADNFNPTVGGGLITITAATAVPEPGTLALFSLATIGVGYRRIRRSRTRTA